VNSATLDLDLKCSPTNFCRSWRAPCLFLVYDSGRIGICGASTAFVTTCRNFVTCLLFPSRVPLLRPVRFFQRWFLVRPLGQMQLTCQREARSFVCNLLKDQVIRQRFIGPAGKSRGCRPLSPTSRSSTQGALAKGNGKVTG
jgi:hypothetical protein